MVTEMTEHRLEHVVRMKRMSVCSSAMHISPPSSRSVRTAFFLQLPDWYFPMQYPLSINWLQKATGLICGEISLLYAYRHSKKKSASLFSKGVPSKIILLLFAFFLEYKILFLLSHQSTLLITISLTIKKKEKKNLKTTKPSLGKRMNL